MALNLSKLFGRGKEPAQFEAGSGELMTETATVVTDNNHPDGLFSRSDREFGLGSETIVPLDDDGETEVARRGFSPGQDSRMDGLSASEAEGDGQALGLRLREPRLGATDAGTKNGDVIYWSGDSDDGPPTGNLGDTGVEVRGLGLREPRFGPSDNVAKQEWGEINSATDGPNNNPPTGDPDGQADGMRLRDPRFGPSDKATKQDWGEINTATAGGGDTGVHEVGHEILTAREAGSGITTGITAKLEGHSGFQGSGHGSDLLRRAESPDALMRAGNDNITLENFSSVPGGTARPGWYVPDMDSDQSGMAAGEASQGTNLDSGDQSTASEARQAAGGPSSLYFEDSVRTAREAAGAPGIHDIHMNQGNTGQFRPNPAGDGTTEHFFRPNPAGDGTTEHFDEADALFGSAAGAPGFVAPGDVAGMKIVDAEDSNTNSIAFKEAWAEVRDGQRLSDDGKFGPETDAAVIMDDTDGSEFLRDASLASGLMRGHEGMQERSAVGSEESGDVDGADFLAWQNNLRASNPPEGILPYIEQSNLVGGERFNGSEDQIRSLMGNLKERGLIDTSTGEIVWADEAQATGSDEELGALVAWLRSTEPRGVQYNSTDWDFAASPGGEAPGVEPSDAQGATVDKSVPWLRAPEPREGRADHPLQDDVAFRSGLTVPTGAGDDQLETARSLPGAEPLGFDRGYISPDKVSEDMAEIVLNATNLDAFESQFTGSDEEIGALLAALQQRGLIDTSTGEVVWADEVVANGGPGDAGLGAWLRANKFESGPDGIMVWNGQPVSHGFTLPEVNDEVLVSLRGNGPGGIVDYREGGVNDSTFSFADGAEPFGGNFQGSDAQMNAIIRDLAGRGLIDTSTGEIVWVEQSPLGLSECQQQLDWLMARGLIDTSTGEIAWTRQPIGPGNASSFSWGETNAATARAANSDGPPDNWQVQRLGNGDMEIEAPAGWAGAGAEAPGNAALGFTSAEGRSMSFELYRGQAPDAEEGASTLLGHDSGVADTQEQMSLNFEEIKVSILSSDEKDLEADDFMDYTDDGVDL